MRPSKGDIGRILRGTGMQIVRGNSITYCVGMIEAVSGTGIQFKF